MLLFLACPPPPVQTSGTGSKQGQQECTDRGSLFLQGAGKGEGVKRKAEVVESLSMEAFKKHVDTALKVMV